MYYPKVLIIGQHFDNVSGCGITLTNLFFGWDKNNIAVAASYIDNPDFSVCEKYYRMGSLEIERSFPFNYIFKKYDTKSGIIQKIDIQKKSTTLTKRNESKLLKIKNYLLASTGQFHRINRFVISKELSDWINDFAPDIIYSQLSSLELIRFISKLQSDIKKPVAIHMVDDWPMSITNNQKGLFKLYWTHIIDKELGSLLKKAKVLLSISEDMSEAYSVRYGQKFIPFHNPISIKDWLPFSKKNWGIKDTFRILYTGRIGVANNKSILFISNVISAINQLEIKKV